MRYCALILLLFAACVLVCVLINTAVHDTWKDWRFLVMHHTEHAQYVIRESRSIIVGIILLITVDRFVV